MSNENACPTVPPPYTRDSGTRDAVRDNSRDKPGTKSLKALALATLSVPLERGKAGQGAGQASKSCPTHERAVGQKKEVVFSPKEEKLSLEKYEPSSPSLEEELSCTSEQLAEMHRLLVRCPVRQCRLHCWNCGVRCPRGTRCTAWHGLRQDVEYFQGVAEPESFRLWESWIIEKGPL